MSSPPRETRSQRRRAENGGIDPQRRSINPLTHQFLPSGSGPSTPTRTTQSSTSRSELQAPTRPAPRRPSRQDRSSSPFDPERAYRTQDTIEPPADARRETEIYRSRTPVPGQFGHASSSVKTRAGGVLGSSTLPRQSPWVSTTYGTKPLEAPTLTDSAAIVGSDPIDEQEPADVTEERDAPIRESVEDSEDDEVAEDDPTTMATVEALRSHVNTIGLHIRTPSGHLIKHSHPTYGRPVDENPHPVSDAFLQSLLPLGETLSGLSDTSSSEATQIPSTPTEAETQALASYHSTNHSPPFEWCSHPRCPITTPLRHHAGMFLQTGTIPPSEPNPIWGWSDPPENIWQAYEGWELGEASLGEAALIDGFMEAHACYDSLFSESSEEEEEEEQEDEGYGGGTEG